MSLTKLEPENRRKVLDTARDRKGKIHCVGCGKIVYKGGYELDHIIPEIESTPEMRSDWRNMQVLCNGKDGCHAKKTAAEAKRYARKNRPPRPWRGIALIGFVALAFTGWTIKAWAPGLLSLTTWYEVQAGLAILGLCTFLVQNAFNPAPPPEKKTSKTETKEPGSALDVARIREAARELMGPKGEIHIIDIVGLDAFTLTYAGTGFAAHDDDKRFELVRLIASKMGDRWEAAWDTRHDRVRLTKRPPLPKLVHHPGLQPGRPWHMLPAADGVAFDLTQTSHILIVGETNSGKTSLQRSFVVAGIDSASRGEVELILLDPKQIEMIGFKGWPGVKRIVSETEDLWDIAGEIEDEMNRRYRLFREEGLPLYSHPKWLIIVDEFKEYSDRMRRHWTTGKDEDGKPLKKSGQRQPPPLDSFTSILGMARKCGIHLIISTLSPDANVFGASAVRQNMAGRATFGAIDGIRAFMMYGDSSIGRDIPSDAKGRATIQIGDGKPVEIQAYWLPDAADADPTYRNTAEDWKTLLRLGMSKEMLPENFRDLL
jgi:energy-coupling factor transporter ATP-binding protein EcfA2